MEDGRWKIAEETDSQSSFLNPPSSILNPRTSILHPRIFFLLPVSDPLLWAIGPVLDDLDLFKRHESFGHHLVNLRQQLVDFLLRIDNFYDDRQILGKAKDLRGMQTAVGAESHRTAEDGGAGEMKLAGFQDDGFVERLSVPLVTLADKDSQKITLLWNLHGITLLTRTGPIDSRTRRRAGQWLR